MYRLFCTVALVATLTLPPLVAAATAPKEKKQRAARPEPAGPPDHSDLRYGPHVRNVMDLWLANNSKPTPLVIFIHGGGFRQGDKSTVPAVFVQLCRERGISVASLNYRLSAQAPYPAQMLDCARAVQWLRHRAKEYHLDPAAFGATGGSAGAAISLWLAFHDDLADAQSSDPVARQSTRLRAVVTAEGQTTLDPRVIAKIVNEETARFPSLPPFYGLAENEDVLTTTRAFPVYEASSAATHVTRDDPPVLLFYRRPTAKPAPSDTMTGIHHANFGFYLKQKMDALGLSCIVRTPDDYPDGNVEARRERETVEFFVRHLSSRH